MPQDPWAQLDSLTLKTPKVPKQNDPWAVLDSANVSTAAPVSDYESQRSIDARNQESLRSSAAKLRAIKPRDAVQKAKLDKMIAQYDMETDGSLTRGTTDPFRSQQENLYRGIGAGLLTSVPTVIGIGSSVLEHIPGPVGRAAHNVTDVTDELNTRARDLMDAQGGAGAIGDFAGNILDPAGAWKQGSALAFNTAKRFAPKTAATVEKLLANSDTPFAKKIAATVAHGLPFNAAMVARPIEIPEGTTPEDEALMRQHGWLERGKNMLTIAGIEAIGGALGGRASVKTLVRAGEPGIETPTKPSDIPVDRAQQLADIEAKRMKAEAQKKESQVVSNLAKSEWQQANPTGLWSKLKPEERVQVKKAWREANGDRLAEILNPTAHAGVVAGEVPSVAQEGVPSVVVGQAPSAGEIPRVVPKPTEPVITGHEQVDGGGSEIKHLVTLDTHKGPYRVIVYTSLDGKSARVDWFGHAEKPEEPLGITGTKAVTELLKKEFPGVEHVNYDRMGGTHATMDEADRQKFKDLTPSADPNLDKPKQTELPLEMTDEQIVEHMTNGQETAHLIEDVQKAGGLTTREEEDLFVKHLEEIRHEGLTPEEYHKQVQELVRMYDPREDAAPTTTPESTTPLPPQESTETLPSDALGTQPQPQTPPVDIPPMQEFETLPGDPSTLDNKQLGLVEDKLLEKILSDKTSPEERIAAENDMQRIADVRIERNKGQKYVPVNTSVPEDAQIRPDLPSNTTGAQINPPMDAPERPVEVTRVSAGGESTYLQAVKHETPLEEMSAEKREKLRAKIIAKMDQLNVADPKQAEKHSELGNDLATLEAVGQQGNSGPLVDPAVKAAREERAAEGDPVADIDPKQYAKDYRTKLRDMTDEKLRVHGQETAFQIDGNPDPDAVKMLSQRLDKIKEERANRYLSPGGGLTAQIPPTIGGGVAGFIGGWASPADDEKERWEHAWLGALAGAAGGKFLSKYNKQVAGKAYDTRTAAELPGGEWQAEIQKHVVTGYEAPKRQLGFLEKMRTAYFQIVHRSAAGERFTESIGANNLATARNPGKLMAMYGRWTAMSEAAFKYGPSLVDEFGNTKHLGASSPHDILDSVGGDVETLGQLMAARTKVEMGESVKTPFDIVAATNFFKKAPEVFHKAADAARQLSLAMADVAVDAGLLSKNGREAFANETMYAALMRVFKYDSAASSISAEKGQAGVVGAQNPLRGRTGGSKDAIKNPFESMYEMIPRMYRAAELNKIKGSFIDAWEAADKPKEWMQRISGKESGNEAEHQAYVKALKAEIQMTDADAHAMVAGLDPDAINIKKGTMRVYRNGVVQTYKIHPDLAQAMLSLNPDEMHWVTRALGAPARLASTGIVLNPFFVAKMGFFDMFQATANSQYGFRFGIDNMRGYWNIVNQSSKYKKLLGAGLSHQGLSSVGTTLATSAEGFRQQAGAPMEIAVRALKEARPLDFYKALISPVADAARVGEALRALDHGASDIDAVFAAKHVTGNYSEIGAWSGMRGLQHMTMFLGPAFQILDTAAYRGGVHLFRVGEAGRVADFSRYAIKSMLMIGLPSYYFWHKAESEDDQQIRDLRSSAPTNWYYRLNWDVKGYGNKGDIVKIPKPILDGQIFGTSVESALDHQKGNDPINMAEFSKAVGQQAAFNLLPTVGVIPLSLQANQDMSSGWAIEPQGDQNLPTEMRGADKATWMSRTLSHAIAPKFEGLNIPMLQHSLSPAGMDFLFNAVGGMLGQDAVKSVSQAMEYQETGYIPSKEEYPIMKQVFVQNPLRSTKEIERFYQGAGPVEQVGAAISHMMKEDPESLLPYMERHQKEYALVGMYAQARTQMAGFRRAINDLRNVHTDVISSQQRRETIAEYLDMMNERAKMVNEMAKDY